MYFFLLRSISTICCAGTPQLLPITPVSCQRLIHIFIRVCSFTRSIYLFFRLLLPSTYILIIFLVTWFLFFCPYHVNFLIHIFRKVDKTKLLLLKVYCPVVTTTCGRSKYRYLNVLFIVVVTRKRVITLKSLKHEISR